MSGTYIEVNTPTAGFDSPFAVPSTLTNNMLYLHRISDEPIDLHIAIDDFTVAYTRIVIRGSFRVHLFKRYTTTEPESIDFGTIRMFLVDVESFSTHAYNTDTLAVSGEKPFFTTNLNNVWPQTFTTVWGGPGTDLQVTGFEVVSSADTEEMMKFNLMSIRTPLSQTVLNSADGDFKILLAGVNLLGLQLTDKTSLSNSIPCHVTQEGTTGSSTVTFAQAQSIIILEDVAVSSSDADALTLKNQRDGGSFEVRLKSFTNSLGGGATPHVRLVSDSGGIGSMRITSNVASSSAAYTKLDCNLTLDASTVASGQTGHLFQFQNVKLAGSLSVGTVNGGEGLNSLVELLNVHVDARGAGYWEPKSSRISFRGSTITSTNSPPANWTNEPTVCVVEGLRVRYTAVQGRVAFEHVILVSDVPGDHAAKSAIANANYALVVKSEVSGGAVKNVPVNFEGNNVVVVKNQDAYGMLFNSSANMAHVRIAAGTSATIRAYRAYTGTAPLTNVGVVFMGANIADEPFDIGEFDMSHMGFDVPSVEDEEAYLSSIVFGTSAMSIDEAGNSNLSTIAKQLVGQKPKWISRKGHHLTSWKYDEVPVFYRKIDTVSGRKVLYADADGLNAVPMRQDLVFILGLTDESSEFTGANGGLVGMDLELHSNANVDALVTDGLINSETAGNLLNELELKLFGKAEAGNTVTPAVGIAGFMNSETGGSEIIRVFNAQPVGEVSVFFEPDEGFLQGGQRRYYYLGDSVFKARFYDASTTSLFQSQHPSAWGLPAFSYALAELDEVDAKLVYEVEGTDVEYEPDPVNPVTLTSTSIPVHLEPDHAFLLYSSVWIDPGDEGSVAKLEALQVNGEQFENRPAVNLKPSASSLYGFTFVTSNTFNIRHSTTTSWANEELATIVFRIIPYLGSSTPLGFNPETSRASALVLKQPQNVEFTMKANVSVITTVPNLFLLRRNGQNVDVQSTAFLENVKSAQNSLDVNLFEPSTAVDAQYVYNSSNIGQSQVLGERCMVGMTMFSRASETPNSFVTSTLGNSGKQLFAIIPEDTDVKLYSAGASVNTFAKVGASNWFVESQENCDVLSMNLEFNGGTYANGTYMVLAVPNEHLGDLSATIESKIIRFFIRPRTTDADADMANQTMGRIMCGRFRIVPLKQNTNGTPTISQVYHLFSRVPALYSMKKTSGTPLTSGALRIYQFHSQNTSISDLEIQFVAKPHHVSGQEDIQLLVDTETLPPAGTTLSFEISQKAGFVLQDAPITFDAASSINLLGTTSSRVYKLGTKWADRLNPANPNRIFSISLVHIRTMTADNNSDNSTTSSGAILTANSTPTDIEQQHSTVLLNWYDQIASTLEQLEQTLSGSGNTEDGQNLTAENLFDIQIRSSSRSSSDFTIASSDDAGISREIQLSETKLVPTGDFFSYSSPTRTLRPVGTPELTRKLASISERIWVGTLFRSQVLDSQGGRVQLSVHFNGTYSVTPGSVSSDPPRFYTSHSGGTLVNEANPITYNPQLNAQDPDPDRSPWLGAWLDVSDLQMTGTTSSTTVVCAINMVLRSEGSSRFTNGVSTILGYVDLTDAGRVELVDMSGTQLSSLRIGNWTLYSDAAGDLRATHRTFVTGEGSGTDAGVRFTLDAPSVEALKDADGQAPVPVAGTEFRLTGHANTA